MINQLLNRDFVLNQLQQVQHYLSLPAEDRRRGATIPPEANQVSEEDLRVARDEVGAALAAERLESSGQSPLFGRRGGEPPLDDWFFLGRDRVISNLQTVLDYYFTDGPGRNRVRITPAPESERRGSGLPSLTGNASLSGLDPLHGDGRRLFNKFSVTDLEWVSCGLAAGLRLFRGRHRFVEDAPTVPVDDQARMIVVGDWGSGIPRAQKIAEHMRTHIDQGISENREVHVVHLGDVYYSGWQREYETRFLPFWPVKPGEAGRIHCWCLNGNHDMYSGGFGYYDFLLRDPRFAAQKGSSFFCLENSCWRIFGLDSSWDDGGLKDPQGTWVSSRLDTRENPRKKTMLLTHHQPFSSYEKPATSMASKLAPVLNAADGVKAWFWGHEHRFMLFRSFEKVDFGRLIGHGGVPVYMTHQLNDDYPTPGFFEDRRFIKRLGGLEHWAYLGFAVLDFNRERIDIQYIDEDGNRAFDSVDTIV